MARIEFYKRNLENYIENKSAAILVLGADTLDQNLFYELGYKNVVFSNYNNSKNKEGYKNLLMQKIDLNDGSFDYCVAHACVHHSSQPHNSVLEMYRVAKKGVLVIEANDCLLTRIACKFKIAEEFEKTAVEKNITHGGVDNTNVPNYVYRWTEREVYKLINSYVPNKNHQINYLYDYDIKFTKNILVKVFFNFFFVIFKKQQNLFSFFINKI